MSYITTYTRKHFDPVHPDPENICIEDIAHALSMLCRGNGHVSSFWSVGEHCICCAKEALGRFPTIEEDEPAYRLLCTEYPAAKD